MKLLFILFISISTLNVTAQNLNNFKQVSTGIKIGSEIGLMLLDNTTLSANTDVDFGYSIMVDFIEYRFNQHLATNIGIGFTNRKYGQTIDNVQLVHISEAAKGKELLLVQNIEIPLTMHYYLNTNNSNRQFYLSVGSTLFYNLHHNFKQELIFSDGTIWEYNNQNDLKRSTFAATVGIGLELRTNYHFSYVIEPIIQVNPNKIQFQYGATTKALTALGILVGVKF